MNLKNYLLIFTILILCACNKIDISEPDDKDFVNKLLINGVESEITFGEVVAYDKLPANTNYNFDLILHTGTTTVVYSPEWTYSGHGSYFSFSLWSEDSTIASGTYTIDGFVNKDFSITKAAAELNVDWSTGESDFGSFLDGTVQIVKLQDFVYEIVINCTDYEGNPVTAFYQGEFYYVDN